MTTPENDSQQYYVNKIEIRYNRVHTLTKKETKLEKTFYFKWSLSFWEEVHDILYISLILILSLPQNRQVSFKFRSVNKHINTL